MRIMEVFTSGHDGHGDDCCGGSYNYGYGYDYSYEDRNRRLGGDKADFNDRDTPLPMFEGSRAFP